MAVKIKDEHKPLIEKIAQHTLDENWDDDAVINLITAASVMEMPSKESGGENLLNAFGSKIDLLNLCYLIENHYNLGPVCQAIIKFRMEGEI